MTVDETIQFSKRMEELPPYFFGMINSLKMEKRRNGVDFFEEIVALAKKFGFMAVAPGIGFGEEGENFLRLALVENEHRIRQAIRQMRRALPKIGEAAEKVDPKNR